MTYPLATLGPTITPGSGVTVPALEDIILSLQATAQGIWGDDIYLSTDTQDQQDIIARAQSIFDSNMAFVACYNAYSPATASGAGLSSIVKTNGLSRQPGSNSTAIVNISGVAGTIIENGIVQDTQGNLWDLPATITIPNTGIIAVTATCETVGAIVALENTLTTIYTIVVGWQSVTNPAAAVTGAAIETDGALRLRQSVSQMVPSQTRLDAIAAAIANLTGVVRSKVYQNNTAETDGNGIPSHSICAVVQGGDAATIAATIFLEKSEGTGTYGGNTPVSETVIDSQGMPIVIKYDELTQTQIYVVVDIQALPGYVATTGQALISALVAFINSLAIGQKVYQTWLLAEAALTDSGLNETFVITYLYLGTAPAPGGTGDIAIAFDAAATTSTGNITLNVTG